MSWGERLPNGAEFLLSATVHQNTGLPSAEIGDLFAMGREMNSRKNNRPRTGMTRAEVVKKLLTEVIGGIDIEDKEIGLGAEDKILGFGQAMRDVDLRLGRGLI